MARDQPARAFLYQEIYDLAPTSYKDTVRKRVRGSRNLSPEVVRTIRTSRDTAAAESAPPGASPGLAAPPAAAPVPSRSR